MDELDEATDLLAELVALESPSGDLQRLQVIGARVAELLSEVGCACELRPGGSVVGLLDGDPSDAVLVLGHTDTVWPVGRLAAAPFTVRDGIATGPGVFDMKAGLVALYLALREIDGGGLARRRQIRVLLTADEEIGSPDGAAVVREQMDGVRAVFALEPPLAGGKLKVGRRGVARALLRVSGREAHAGLDAARGVSATDELVDQLITVRSALDGDDTLSVNVGTLAGGSRANVVAADASAELGLRFATEAAEVRVFDTLGSLRPSRDGATVALEVLSRRPPWEPTGSLALLDHVRAVAAELGQAVTAGISPGAGDANITGAAGYPTVDGLGPTGQGAHAPDEAVDLRSIRPRASLLAQLLTRPLPMPNGDDCG